MKYMCIGQQTHIALVHPVLLFTKEFTFNFFLDFQNMIRGFNSLSNKVKKNESRNNKLAKWQSKPHNSFDIPHESGRRLTVNPTDLPKL